MPCGPRSARPGPQIDISTVQITTDSEQQRHPAVHSRYAHSSRRLVDAGMGVVSCEKTNPEKIVYVWPQLVR